MLYDANASVGSWPFRPLPTRTAGQLLARLDEIGVDRALVASLNAVCYRDVYAGTEELLAEIAPYRDRLTPVAVLNPLYAGWQRDLDAACAAGCVGLRLYPNYHRYELTGADGRKLLAAAVERDLLLCFVCRHEDRRQRHWMDTPEDLSLAEIAAGLDPFPQARFLILEPIGLESSPFAVDPRWRERRFGLDISRLTSVLTNSIPNLIDRIGAEKLVFGTGLPLKGPNSALLKLNLIEDSAARSRIGGANLQALLGETPA